MRPADRITRPNALQSPVIDRATIPTAKTGGRPVNTKAKTRSLTMFLLFQ
jgi:hypothetical protein